MDQTSLKTATLPVISISSPGAALGSMPNYTRNGSIQANDKLFVPGHRKSRSLGNNVILETLGRELTEMELRGSSSVGRKDNTDDRRSIDESTGRRFSYLTSQGDSFRGRHYLDDSVIEEPPSLGDDAELNLKLPAAIKGGFSNYNYNRKLSFDKQETTPIASTSSKQVLEDNDSGFTEPVESKSILRRGKSFRRSSGPERPANCIFEGYVKRKTVVKDGKKPAISAWIRYWIQLNGTDLVYFPPKTLRGTQRENFRDTSCKTASLSTSGWVATLCSDSEGPLQADSFYLTDPTGRSVYRFKISSPSESVLWTMHLNALNIVEQHNLSKFGRPRSRTSASPSSQQHSSSSLKCLLPSDAEQGLY